MNTASDEPGSWSTADFDEISWHDNHIHGFELRQGEFGAGELVIDLDFIVEWICDPATGKCEFDLAPATLSFAAVTDLAISIDYAADSAAMGPLAIDHISREPVSSDARSFRWTIHISWPRGQITFSADGFTQVLRAAPIRSEEQALAADVRRALLT